MLQSFNYAGNRKRGSCVYQRYIVTFDNHMNRNQSLTVVLSINSANAVVVVDYAR